MLWALRDKEDEVAVSLKNTGKKTFHAQKYKATPEELVSGSEVQVVPVCQQ